MYSRDVTVINRAGLHARPASELVQAAQGFDSKITIGRVGADDSVSAKSIVMLLSMGFELGTDVTITATGPDEQRAVDQLVALIESGFRRGPDEDWSGQARRPAATGSSHQ